MNDYIQENKRSLYMLVGLLFLLAIVLFFLVLRPVMKDLEAQKRTNQAKEEDIELLELQLANMKKQLEEEDPEQLVLENKVPLERKIDEYILSLKQLENKTNSEISNIEFIYDSSMEVLEDEAASSEDAGETEESEESPAEEVILGKPEELQAITVRFTATSPSFKDFVKLLETIEQEERISIVSNIEFRQTTDYTSSEDEERVSFDVHLTTFYYQK